MAEKKKVYVVVIEHKGNFEIGYAFRVKEKALRAVQDLKSWRPRAQVFIETVPFYDEYYDK